MKITLTPQQKQQLELTHDTERDRRVCDRIYCDSSRDRRLFDISNQ